MSACTRQRTLPETHYGDTGTTPPKVVRCVLNADHVGYHVDEDGLPFGPWIETSVPPARPPAAPETECRCMPWLGHSDYNRHCPANATPECTCDQMAHPCEVHDCDHPGEVRGPDRQPVPPPPAPHRPVGGSETPDRGVPRDVVVEVDGEPRRYTATKSDDGTVAFRPDVTGGAR